MTDQTVLTNLRTAHYGDWGLDLTSQEVHELLAEIETRDKRVAELEAEQARWVMVSERLPELYDKVLVYCEHGYTTEVTILNYEAGLFPFDNVTHWMPLPKPPEVQRQ